jgi:hypothetical protein
MLIKGAAFFLWVRKTVSAVWIAVETRGVHTSKFTRGWNLGHRMFIPLCLNQSNRKLGFSRERNHNAHFSGYRLFDMLICSAFAVLISWSFEKCTHHARGGTERYYFTTDWARSTDGRTRNAYWILLGNFHTTTCKKESNAGGVTDRGLVQSDVISFFLFTNRRTNYQIQNYTRSKPKSKEPHEPKIGNGRSDFLQKPVQQVRDGFCL